MRSKVVCELISDAAAGNGRNSEGSFIRLQDGRILFYFTQYHADDCDFGQADLAFCTSADDGETWSKPEIFIKGPEDGNVMSVSLLRLQNGRIMMSYLQKKKLDGGRYDCRPKVCFSDDECASWTEPFFGTDVPGYYVQNNDRIVQLSTGRILLPNAYTNDLNQTAIVVMFYSDDDGATWNVSNWILPPQEKPARVGLQEPGVIELEDGTVFCWQRTDWGYQYFSTSADQGLSWSAVQPEPSFPAPCSPLSMKRDPADGRYIAVWNDIDPRWKAPVRADSWSYSRARLVMAFSSDCKHWADHTLLEYDYECGYCYTAIEFLPDRSFLLAYCCGGYGKSCLQDLRIRKFYI